jgi:hypothetical protein
MGRLIAGIVMVLFGLLGLACTACGAMFLPMSGAGLIGLVPGALMLWAAWKIWRSVFGKAPPTDPGDPS